MKPRSIEANLYKLTHPNKTESYVLAMNMPDAATYLGVTAVGNIDCVDKVERVRDVRVTQAVLDHHFGEPELMIYQREPKCEN